MNPVELIVRHSFAPNRRGYCGGADYSEKIRSFVGKNSPALQAELEFGLQTFRGLFGYLGLIAAANQKQVFESGVGEAYWIGNDLLNSVSSLAVRELFLNRFSSDDYLGSELAANFANRLPKRFFVHHSFHVFFVHFMTSQLDASVPNLDSCRVSWGRVAENRPGKLVVESRPLVQSDKQLFLSDPALCEIDSFFSDRVSVGDWVSFHWGTYCMKLSAEQKKNLEFFTAENLSVVNRLTES